MSDWLWMSAGDLGREIGAGRIGPVELTEAYLDAIDRHPARDRIYSTVTPERARAEARAAEERARGGLRRHALDGVPISWKDLFDSAGTSTEAGTKLLEGRVPDKDAEVLRNATAAGLVCLGKTHMSELAFSGLGLNPMTATPPNVHDERVVPGGSSSGAAASVAFGLAANGVGSDTGGSVRIPSAWNDLVGLKTTAGRVSNAGVVPLAARFDTVGPLSRDVEDCALMLSALEGGPVADLDGATLQGARLAILTTSVFEDIRDAPKTAFEAAVAKLRDAGAEIEEIEAPEVAEAMPMSPILFTSEAYGTWGQLIESAPEAMFAPIRKRFRSGKDFLAADYVAAWQRLEELRSAWQTRVAAFDAVLMPTAPNLPPDASRLMTDDDYYVTENLLALRNTRVGNLMGLCGVTLPTGTPACGLLLSGKPFGEEALLRLAKAAEDALG
ncbi:amidase [Roseovarius aestuariivivens]|uniref:amidase n=1 Tax=Roseovarius aestuariivivens TaxID=1888910 RepID=UPI00107FF986|nr:amidase family protein [Roseovarius aestuariivivens]